MFSYIIVLIQKQIETLHLIKSKLKEMMKMEHTNAQPLFYREQLCNEQSKNNPLKAQTGQTSYLYKYFFFRKRLTPSWKITMQRWRARVVWTGDKYFQNI